jgi:membrane-associated phospholipid phosphatase
LADPPASSVDRLLGGYLLITALVVVFPHRPESWPVLLGAHLALGLALLAAAPQRIRESVGGGAIRALVDWYPLLLMPVLYWELPLLGGSLWDGRFFDAVVQGWEARLFGGQPSVELAGRWPWLPLSELLHLFYLAYYPVIYLFPAALYLRGQRESFRATVFAVMLGFTACYVVFTLFPVQGPRYLFPAPGGAAAEGWMYQLTHRILESGSSQGAAFPSSHAAIAAVQTVNAGRYLPKAAPLLALITAGICVGAVYGGFHYAIDMAVGAAFGVLVGWLAPSVRRRLA